MTTEWTDGVGGVQCDECERTTICKEFGVGQEEDGDSEWLCRPCYVGDDLDDCGCLSRVNADGALIVIANSECDRHRPAILDVQS